MKFFNSGHFLPAIFAFGVLLLIYSGGDFVATLNNSLRQNSVVLISGVKPDTNIVLMTIGDEEINELGWPLKRSYYALLLNKLQEYAPKVVGFEIFFSDINALQTIYNELLLSEIRKADNIVLSSIGVNVYPNGELFAVDSVLKSFSGYDLAGIHTGHLNVIEDKALIIPERLTDLNSSILERSFSNAVVSSYLNKIPVSVSGRSVNFLYELSEFKQISFLQFLRGTEDERRQFGFLKDKIVIVGVISQQIARSFRLGDFIIPGLALHAFAIDNYLHSRFLNTSLYTILPILLLLLLFALQIPIKQNSILFCVGILFFSGLVVAASLFNFHFDFVLFAAPALTYLLLKSFGLKIKAGIVKSFSLVQGESKEVDINESRNMDLRSDSRIEEGESAQTEAEGDFSDDDNLSIEYPVMKEYRGILYSDQKMEKMTGLIKQIASENATVLIVGESGTGKELVARAIHNDSKRAENPFIAVNCAALSESLLESELFGHVKGAFTGALSEKKGRFELADSGTIFLDEIGETNENFQVKLLRVLQSGEFERVGSGVSVKCNVRVIAATNKDPEKLVALKKFREDLYYRLNVFRINVPPLRERKNDIAGLAKYIAEREAPGIQFSDYVLKTLLENDWKGNIRELESVIKSAVIMAKFDEADRILIKHLPESLRKNLKSELGYEILMLLRKKKFSYSAINETAMELGNLSRLKVAENFRGICLKTFVNNSMNPVLTVSELAASDDREIIENVTAKLNTYLDNIKQDVKAAGVENFTECRDLLNSKYKNLPKKYHQFLDIVIKYYLKNE